MVGGIAFRAVSLASKVYRYLSMVTTTALWTSYTTTCVDCLMDNRARRGYNHARCRAGSRARVGNPAGRCRGSRVVRRWDDVECRSLEAVRRTTFPHIDSAIHEADNQQTFQLQTLSSPRKSRFS